MKRDGNIELKSLSQFYKPKTYNQEKYYSYLNDDKIKLLFAVGPAGTGKTMLACNNAVKDLKSGKVEDLVIIIVIFLLLISIWLVIIRIIFGHI